MAAWAATCGPSRGYIFHCGLGPGRRGGRVIGDGKGSQAARHYVSAFAAALPTGRLQFRGNVRVSATPSHAAQYYPVT
eukprot:83520-Chlamydomonas_euryale.AAC.2